jgi:TonB C terminal
MLGRVSPSIPVSFWWKMARLRQAERIPAVQSSGRLKIDIWTASAILPKPIARIDRRCCPPAVWGFVGMLVVHLVLVPTVLLGTALPPRHPLNPQQEGTFDQTKNVPSEDLVLIDLLQAPKRGVGSVKLDLNLEGTRHTMSFSKIADLNPPEVNLPVDSPDDQRPSQLTTDSDGETTRQRLAGIYSGQIHARIERIWRRPRTPISDGASEQAQGAPFQCLVTIIQDSIGRVQETRLVSCNGSIAWQRSLVIAINQASPLPAPPDPKVFTRAVTLAFTGFAFVPGMDVGEYEVQAPPVAQIISTKP